MSRSREPMGSGAHSFPALLGAKLRPPQTRMPQLQRDRLQRRLMEVKNASVALVVAPAGYGKTVILQHCYEELQQQDCIVGWAGLDQHDNDVARFFALLLASVRESVADFGEDLLRTLRLESSPATDLLIAHFVAAARDLKRPVYLFLDDFHVLDNSRLMEVFSQLLHTGPEFLHWIISSRNIPMELPLARLRVMAELVEVRANELSMTEKESCNYLERCAGVNVDPLQVSVLNRHTEGWIAGLQLASLSIRNASDPQSWIHGFSGEHQHCRAFLADEVLNSLSPELQEFLMFTSVVERFHRDLCLALTQSRRSSQCLEKVIELQLFVFSLDNVDEWFRYHHLFSGFLRRRLQEKFPGMFVTLNQRAAEWFAADGHYVEAIHHACLGRQYEQAAGWLEAIGEQLMASGKVHALDKFSGVIPDEVLQSHPRLILDIAWEQILHWDFVAGKRLLNIAENAMLDKGSMLKLSAQEQRYLRGKLHHRKMIFSYISDDLKTAEKLSDQWLQSDYPQDENLHMLTSVQIIRQTARRERFDFGNTLALANAMDDLCIRNNVLHGSVYHDCQVGITLSIQNEVDAARGMFIKARERAIELHGPLSSLAAMPSLLLAELLWQRDETDEASTLVSDYLTRGVQVGIVDQLIAGYLTKSRLAEFSDGVDKALAILDEGEKLVWKYEFFRLQFYLTHERVRILARLGKVDGALEIGRQQGLTTYNAAAGLEAGTVSELVRAMTRARLMACRGDLDSAIRLLKRWLTLLQRASCNRLLIEVNILLAVMTARQGDRHRALSHMSDAVTVEGAGNWAGLIRLEGRESAELVVALSELSVAKPVEAMIRVAREVLSEVDQLEPDSDIDSGVDELKPREIEILQLAADDRSNQEIGERLAISTNTVKWYWRQIFEKLDVRRRGSAVRKARDIGLIV